LPTWKGVVTLAAALARLRERAAAPAPLNPTGAPETAGTCSNNNGLAVPMTADVLGTAGTPWSNVPAILSVLDRAETPETQQTQ
jgi:hypothetical protein